VILDDRMDNGDLIILDGATGSEIRNFGAVLSPVVWCGAANLQYPDAVQDVHEAYIEAGADVVTTNTFATCRHVLDAVGLASRAVEVTKRGVELAFKARDAAADDRDVAVAGSLSSMTAWIPGTIKSDPQFLPSSRQQWADNLFEQAQALCDAGVDFLILEMMTNADFDVTVAEAARATGLPVWCGLSASFAPDRRVVAWDAVTEHPEETLDDGSEFVEFADVVDAFVEFEPQVMGVMHSTLAVTAPALDRLRSTWKGPLMAYPETIGTDEKGDRNGVSAPPKQFAEQCAQLVSGGVQVVGGCCGTTIAHLRQLARTLEREPG